MFCLLTYNLWENTRIWKKWLQIYLFYQIIQATIATVVKLTTSSPQCWEMTQTKASLSEWSLGFQEPFFHSAKSGVLKNSRYLYIEVLVALYRAVPTINLWNHHCTGSLQLGLSNKLKFILWWFDIFQFPIWTWRSCKNWFANTRNWDLKRRRLSMRQSRWEETIPLIRLRKLTQFNSRERGTKRIQFLSKKSDVKLLVQPRFKILPLKFY